MALWMAGALGQNQVPYDFSITHTNMTSMWNQADWTLTTTDFVPLNYQSRMSLANGYVGASLAAAGPFFEYDVNQTNPDGANPANVWPLFSRRLSFTTISGFYNIQPNGTGTNYPWLNQYGWEQFIAGIPHATGILFDFGGQVLNANVTNDTISSFESTISFKTGIGSWSYIWSPEGVNADFNVSYQALFHRERPNLIAVEAQITPSEDADGQVTDILDGRSAVRSYLNEKSLDENTTTIEVSFHPGGLEEVTGYEVSVANFDNGFTDIGSKAPYEGDALEESDMTIGQTFNISLKAGQTARFYKFVGVASTDKFENAEFIARQEAQNANATGWDAIVQEHVDAWAEIMTDAAVDNFTDPATGELPDDNEIEILQITSVANTYYLLQQLQPDGSGLNDNSLSVGGLNSESYAGMIFWDADYWMAPGLNLNFPGFTKQISNYRLKQYPQALENARFNNFTNGSVLYSWTSARYGNCTGTGPCVDYEYHLNHDIAFNLLQEYNITQNDTWFNNGPRQLIDSVAQMVGELLEWNATTESWWVHNMTDPDEYANHIDNGAFTIASSADLLLIANDLRRKDGLQINETWRNQSENVEFPQADTGITLEYQTMNNSVEIKQADVVLLTYPLDYDQNDYQVGNKLLDLDYYSNKQSPDGPAMTYSIHAIAANAISPSGCAAYSYTLHAILPYLRAPFYQYSEQNDDNVITNGRQNPAFPFLTGHGGSNQIVPFGFLGLRTDQPVMFINPSLPPQIPNVRIRDFYYAGTGVRASMNRTHTTITRFSTEDVEALTDKYQGQPMPIAVGTPGSEDEEMYEVNIDQTIYVPNRMYWQNLTYPGNLLQCSQVFSHDLYAPGQFPQAAIDGAIATVWQPMKNSSASILINMTSSEPQPLKELYFNWGERPPTNATVWLGNDTELCKGKRYLDGEVIKLAVNNIVASHPFDEEVSEAAVVVPYQGNETVIQLREGVWSGKWAMLTIEGCRDCTEDDEVITGATVAEFALVSEQGVLKLDSAESTDTRPTHNDTTPGTGVEGGDGTVEGDVVNLGPGSESNPQGNAEDDSNEGTVVTDGQ